MATKAEAKKQALERLQEASRRGRSVEVLAKHERAAWALGASMAETDAAIADGNEVRARQEG